MRKVACERILHPGEKVLHLHEKVLHPWVACEKVARHQLRAKKSHTHMAMCKKVLHLVQGIKALCVCVSHPMEWGDEILHLHVCVCGLKFSSHQLEWMTGSPLTGWMERLCLTPVCVCVCVPRPMEWGDEVLHLCVCVV